MNACSRCGQPVLHTQSSVVIVEGKRQVFAHVVCRREAIDNARMHHAKIDSEERKQRA